MLAKYPEYTGAPIALMWSIALWVKPEKSPFPEFFWLTFNSDLMSQTYVYDVIHMLSDMGDFREVLRAYLVTMLFTDDVAKDESKLREVIFSFYYVGHTMDSLRTVVQILPLRENNVDLYVLIYGHSLGMLFSERAETLSEDDREFLRAFFQRGLTIEAIEDRHVRIGEDCRAALARLEQLGENEE